MSAARRRILALAVGTTLFWVSACLSPTLPLPPPGEPNVTAPDANGNVTLSGTVRPRAEAVAYHPRSDKAFSHFTDETGAYEIQLPAESGDEISFRYRVHSQLSEAVMVIVPTP